MAFDTDDLGEALQAAAAARSNAYAPYSNFKVGAALRTATGKLYTGCNVENASYGGTICAERGAVMAANAAGERDYRYIVVVTDVEPPALPCALCLQVLAEFCSPDFTVFSGTPEGIVREITLGELLPHPFTEVP
ncbi:MAG: cytidine deaminase [Spirochaetota bacterium]|nr:cytidine deaminase [Spirochaetota bacterium]